MPSFNGHYEFDYGTLDINTNWLSDTEVKITITYCNTWITISMVQVFGLEKENDMVQFVGRALEAYFREEFFNLVSSYIDLNTDQ